jgi:hypothetical protein
MFESHIAAPMGGATGRFGSPILEGMGGPLLVGEGETIRHVLA